MKKTYGKPVLKFLLCTLVFAFALEGAAMAAQAKIVAKINSIYSLMAAIIGAIGMIVLLWGIFEFGSGWLQHDHSQVPESLRKVVAGLILLSAGGLVTLLK